MGALDRGWAGWTKKAAELHTFCTDHENRRNECKGFFKLNEDSIATVCENLAADYKALADHHSEDIVQIMEDYGVADLEIARQLQQYDADMQATGLQTVEIVELPDNPTEEAASGPQGEPVLTTPTPTNGEPAMAGTLEPAPLQMPETTPPTASSVTTTTELP